MFLILVILTSVVLYCVIDILIASAIVSFDFLKLCDLFLSIRQHQTQTFDCGYIIIVWDYKL